MARRRGAVQVQTSAAGKQCMKGRLFCDFFPRVELRMHADRSRLEEGEAPQAAGVRHEVRG